MHTKHGFTILEIIIVAAFASLLFLFFFIQKQNIDAMNRDDARKTTLNALYYALEEGFYPDHGYYPDHIDEDNLPIIDPALWTDPLGFNLGDPLGSYFYEAADCDNGHCREYTLKALLEKEDTYIKHSRN